MHMATLGEGYNNTTRRMINSIVHIHYTLRSPNMQILDF